MLIIEGDNFVVVVMLFFGFFMFVYFDFLFNIGCM